MKKEVFFLGISVIWTAAAGAIQPAEISDEEWASAARISLASAHRFLPVAATTGFSTWQPAMLASMAEFGHMPPVHLCREYNGPARRFALRRHR